MMSQFSYSTKDAPTPFPPIPSHSAQYQCCNLHMERLQLLNYHQISLQLLDSSIRHDHTQRRPTRWRHETRLAAVLIAVRAAAQLVAYTCTSIFCCRCSGRCCARSASSGRRTSARAASACRSSVTSSPAPSRSRASIRTVSAGAQ